MTHELLPVATALDLVRRHTAPLPTESVALLDALGRILAEQVIADADSPPFTKAMMDGYALRAGDVGPRHVIEEILAGMVPVRRVESGQASRIMTGAMVPAGADAVVPVERTRLEGDHVEITGKVPRGGDNILSQGTEMRAGAVLFQPGRVLSPQDIGLLATVGQATPCVRALPRVHVLSTGDEVVPWDATPAPGQIRNSNGAMLAAQVRRAGGVPTFGGIVPDDETQLRASITRGLESDVLLLSGGVSAGKVDLVPGVLAALGVTAHFHKVALKPGKPLLFGTRGSVLVFGLPGNPVSSFVCFELFVRPALALLSGGSAPTVQRLPLAEAVLYRTDRPTYHPAVCAGASVRLVPWFGAADLRGLGAANALAVIPPGDNNLAAGDSVDVLPLEV